MTLDALQFDTHIDALAKARQWDTRTLDVFSESLRRDPDEALVRINPPVFVEQKGIDEAEGIDLFLHAAYHRLMEMEWHIICPYCVNAMESMEHLRQIPAHLSCNACGGHYESALSDYIQVTFSPARHIRPLQKPNGSGGVLHIGGEVVRGGKYLSGTRLMTTQTFRELYPSQTFDNDRSVLVNDITFLFTDLKGSTALYDVLGDAQAYYVVRRHFDILTKIVARCGGAVVKTIGDSVMATFMRPANALQAAREMVRELEALNQTLPRPLSLKIGIHRGHSIAVTLNDRMDYFGQTVNIAARIQHLADANQIYMSDDAYNAPGIERVLESCLLESSEVELRGISRQIRVHCVTAR